MARTVAEFREELLKQTPSWFRDPDPIADALLEGFATVFSLVEEMIETHHARTFIGEADGSWLDEHGRERGKIRGDGETDDEFRARVQVIDDAVTPVAMQAAIDRMLKVGTAQLFECLGDSMFTTSNGSGLPLGFTDVGRTFDDRRCFLVVIEPQLPNRNDTAWTTPNGSGLDTGFTVDSPDEGGAMFTDQTTPTPGDIYTRIFLEVDRLRAAGVDFDILVEA